MKELQDLDLPVRGRVVEPLWFVEFLINFELRDSPCGFPRRIAFAYTFSGFTALRIDAQFVQAVERSLADFGRKPIQHAPGRRRSDFGGVIGLTKLFCIFGDLGKPAFFQGVQPFAYL